MDYWECHLRERGHEVQLLGIGGDNEDTNENKTNMISTHRIFFTTFLAYRACVTLWRTSPFPPSQSSLSMTTLDVFLIPLSPSSLTTIPRSESLSALQPAPILSSLPTLTLSSSTHSYPFVFAIREPIVLSSDSCCESSASCPPALRLCLVPRLRFRLLRRVDSPMRWGAT